MGSNRDLRAVLEGSSISHHIQRILEPGFFFSNIEESMLILSENILHSGRQL